MSPLPAPLRPALPREDPVPPCLSQPCAGTKHRLPLTSLGAELGPHGVWKELSEEARRQVPKSPLVPCYGPGSCYKLMIN